MTPRSRSRMALTAVAVVVVIGVAVVFATTPKPPRYAAIEGRPLLESDGPQFVDPQVKIRFTPPPDWAMQARSAEAPTHRPERQLVKYKRVLKTEPVAWLRVKVSDAIADQTPAAYLTASKPKELGFKPAGAIEEDLTVGGQPAAKRVFGGTLNPDGSGPRAFTAEVVAVRHGDKMFEFACTLLDTDVKGRDQFRAAIESISFE